MKKIIFILILLSLGVVYSETYDSHTIAVLEMENNSLDELNNVTFTAGSGVSYSSSDYKFGSYSYYCETYTTDAAISSASGAGNTTVPHTVEMYVKYPTGYTGSNLYPWRHMYFTSQVGYSGAGWSFHNYYSATAQWSGYTPVLNKGQWYLISWTDDRDNGVVLTYIDGVARILTNMTNSDDYNKIVGDPYSPYNGTGLYIDRVIYSDNVRTSFPSGPVVPTSTPTETFTTTDTFTITETFTITDTPTDTATDTGTATDTDTITETPTNTNIYTDTYTPTPTGTYGNNLIHAWEQLTPNSTFSERVGETIIKSTGTLGNRIWVIAGNSNSAYYNDVYYSYNGTDWTTVTRNANFTARTFATGTYFQNKLWIIGGYYTSYKKDVWYSSDGEVWYQDDDVPWTSGREGSQATTIFDSNGTEKTLVITGGYDGSTYYNDIWDYHQGDWYSNTETIGTSGRAYHTQYQYGNHLYIFGGYNGALLNDIWKHEVLMPYQTWHYCGALPFLGRSGMYGNSWQNNMWIGGGLDSGAYNNDMWRSTDGVTWHRDLSGTFSKRQYASAVPLFSSLAVIGGYNGTGNLNDVYLANPNTPTYTPTFTMTQTITPTFSITSTITPTMTQTNTGTRTITQTSTVTQTLTYVLTATITQTATVIPTMDLKVVSVGVDWIKFQWSILKFSDAQYEITYNGNAIFLTQNDNENVSINTFTYTVKNIPQVWYEYCVFSVSPNFNVLQESVCIYANPNNSPTPKPFPTSTPTITQTITETITQTITLTQTATSGDTNTITDTPTETDTFTVTDTATDTDTATITETPTNTDTFIPTETATYTVTQLPAEVKDVTVSPASYVAGSDITVSFSYRVKTAYDWMSYGVIYSDVTYVAYTDDAVVTAGGIYNSTMASPDTDGHYGAWYGQVADTLWHSGSVVTHIPAAYSGTKYIFVLVKDATQYSFFVNPGNYDDLTYTASTP